MIDIKRNCDSGINHFLSILSNSVTSTLIGGLRKQKKNLIK